LLREGFLRAKGLPKERVARRTYPLTVDVFFAVHPAPSPTGIAAPRDGTRVRHVSYTARTFQTRCAPLPRPAKQSSPVFRGNTVLCHRVPTGNKGCIRHIVARSNFCEYQTNYKFYAVFDLSTLFVRLNLIYVKDILRIDRACLSIDWS
jgi:hypothetical protein